MLEGIIYYNYSFVYEYNVIIVDIYQHKSVCKINA